MYLYNYIDMYLSIPMFMYLHNITGYLLPMTMNDIAIEKHNNKAVEYDFLLNELSYKTAKIKAPKSINFFSRLQY